MGGESDVLEDPKGDTELEVVSLLGELDSAGIELDLHIMVHLIKL